ncbi:MAG: acetylornithine transaminase [Dehalococcoidia bacterium]|nr:acetylornithine transaminase [Dehalococcoidia bacterium]
MDWTELEKKYYAPVYDRLPVTLVRGQGMHVWDDQERRYLDFTAGVAVLSLGHCHPVLVKAIADQAAILVHASNAFYTIPQLELAKLLVEHSAFQKVFFCNSGAEANEAAVKLARRYGHLHLDGAYEVITAIGSFHGRTLAMVAASGQEKFQKPYAPLPAGFVNVAYDDLEAIKGATTSRTCAIMLEPVQGEGGVNVPHPDYLQKVRAWCDENGLLFILDEVQTGIARTGHLFAYQHSAVTPDIITLAKGLASGMPIGAMLATDRASVFALGEHGSTFGGNPLACAAGHAVLEYIIAHDLARYAQEMGERLIAGLEKLKKEHGFITQVRGRGLLLAVEFDHECAYPMVRACLERGLLVNKVKPNAIRLMPPLILTSGDAEEALDILADALGQVEASREP